MLITIDNPKDMGKIADLIHDEWFYKDDIHFFHEKASLELKFRRSKIEEKTVIRKFLFMEKLSFPIVQSFLKINYVESYKIKDKAYIGRYDFNEIKYNERKKMIIITSGFPFVIEVKVTKIQLLIEDSEVILEQKVVWSLW